MNEPEHAWVGHHWRDAADWCHHHRKYLQPREADFIDAMMHWRGEPSQKQLDWLAHIYRRLERKRRRAEGPDFKDRIMRMLEDK